MFLRSNAFRQVYEIHVVSCVVVKSAKSWVAISVLFYLIRKWGAVLSLAVLNYDNIHVFRGLYYYMVGFHVLNPGRNVKPKSLGVVMATAPESARPCLRATAPQNARNPGPL